MNSMYTSGILQENIIKMLTLRALIHCYKPTVFLIKQISTTKELHGY